MSFEAWTYSMIATKSAGRLALLPDVNKFRKRRFLHFSALHHVLAKKQVDCCFSQEARPL